MAEECDCFCSETVMEVSSPSQRAGLCWSALYVPQPSFPGRSFKNERPSRAVTSDCQRTNATSQDASAAPPLARNCCCNHRDTTQTEISRQSQSFKELKLPTKLALGHAPTCESGPAAKPVQTVFSQHLFGMFVVSLLPPTFRWNSRRQGWAKKSS